MTDASLDLDNSRMVASAKEATKSINDLLTAVERLSKLGSEDIEKLSKRFTYLGYGANSSYTALEELMARMLAKTTNGLGMQLNAHRVFNNARQQEFDIALMKLARTGETFTLKELQMWKNRGVALSWEQNRQLKDHAAAKAAWAAKEEVELQKAFVRMQERSAAEEVIRKTAQARSLQNGAQNIRGVGQTFSSMTKQQEYAAIFDQAIANENKILAAKKISAERQALLLVDLNAKIKALNADNLSNILATDKMELAEHQRSQAAILAATAKRIAAENALIGTASYASGPMRGMPMDSTAVSRLNSELSKTPKHLGDTTAGAGKLSNAFKFLTIDGNDTHSMARGLASGFNLLWLTWGNMVPLLAGAAISNAFIQTAKTGSAVAHTMEIIAVLGGNTTEEMALLNTELTRLGKSGPFGPLEVAEGMKVLSLAGLKANEILAVTQDVLNFSVAGTTDLKTSADVLVSVSTAFAMGAAGFGRVADVVSKAAAESKASVESFGGAMKVASVINAQYGVSLVDVATGIATLSQLGIEGTAAGTALRNMYADLSGRSIQVAKVLKSQGIEMRTATGEFKPMLEVIADLNTKLQSLDGMSQKNLMQALLSERGAKGIVEMLRLINTEAKNSGSGMANALAEMRNSIEESYGFAAISAAKLTQTTQNQFLALKATVQTSMNEAFKGLEPDLLVIADAMKKAFGSPEFVAGLQLMTTAITNLGLTVIQNAKFIGEMVLAYGAYRLLQGPILWGVERFTALKVAETAAIEIDTIAQQRNNAAKVGSLSSLGLFAKAIPLVGTAITWATIAWTAYDFWVNQSKDSSQTASDLYNNNVIKDLQDQTAKLRAINALRREGLGLSEAEAKYAAGKRSAEVVAPAHAAYLKASKVEAEAAKALSDAMLPSSKDKRPEYIAALNRQVVNASKAAKTAFEAETKAMRDMNAATTDHVDAAKDAAKIGDDELAKRKKAVEALAGTGTFERGSTTAAVNEKLNAEKKLYDTSIKDIEGSLARKESALKHSYDTDMAMLESLHKNKLISEGEYQGMQLAGVLAFEKNANEARAAALQAEETKVSARKVQVSNSGFSPEKLKAELEAISVAWEAFQEKTAGANLAQGENAMKRLAISSNNAKGELVKLDEEFTKFWRDDSIELEAAVKKNSTSMDEYAKAAEEAGATVQVKYNKALGDLEVRALDAAIALYGLRDALKHMGQDESPEGAVAIANARAYVDSLQAKVTKAKENAAKGVAKAEQTAIDKLREENSTKLVASVSDALIEGSKHGAKDAAKNLRGVIEAELRKPLKVLVETFISGGIQGLQGMLGMGGSSGSGIMGTANGVSSLLNIGSAVTGSASLASIGSAFTSGYTSGAAGLSTLVATNATTGAAVGGATATASSIGAGIGSTLGTALAAIPVWGWVAMGVMALVGSGMFDGGGGPKTESGAGIGLGGNQGSLGGGTTDYVNALETQYSTLANHLDIKNSMKAGAFTSVDNAGDSLTQLQVVSTIDGKQVYNRNNNMGGTENVGRTPEELKAAMSLEASRAVFASLQASDLPKHLAGVFDGLVAKDMTETQVTDAINIAQSFQTLHNQMLALPFKTLADYSFLATKGLVAASGSLELLGNNLTSYYENFYSGAEKTANITKNVTKQFADLGIPMIDLSQSADDVRATFRSLVDTAMLDTSEAGVKVTAGLLAAAPALSSLLEPVTELATAAALAASKLDIQIKIETALGNKSVALTLTRQKELAAMDKALRPMQVYLNALEDEVSIKAELKTAYDAETAAIQKTIDALATGIDSLKAYRDSLVLSDKTVLTPTGKYTEAKNQLSALVTAANSTAVTDAEVTAKNDAISKLPGATDTFLTASRTLYASSAQYTQDFANALTMLDSTSAMLTVQKTDAEKQLIALVSNNTILGLIAVSSETTTVLLQKLLDAQIATGEAKNAMAVAEADAAAKVIADAKAAEAASTLAKALEASNLLVPAKHVGTTIAEIIPPLINIAKDIWKNYNEGSDHQAPAPAPAPAPTPASVYDPYYNEGSDHLYPTPQYARGGLGKGIISVGEEGREIIDLKTPGRIYSAKDTNMFGDNSALIAELQALRAEVAQLRKDQAQQTGHLITANYDANSRAADKVVSATEDATTNADWNARSAVKMA